MREAQRETAGVDEGRKDEGEERMEAKRTNGSESEVREKIRERP